MVETFKLLGRFCCTLIWLFYSKPDIFFINAKCTCATASLPSNVIWYSDPQYPGVCYTHYQSTTDVNTAATRCRNDYNATLPIFHTLDEFHSFQRLYLWLQNGNGDFGPNCASKDINIMLGLNITNYTPTWLDGSPIDPAFYIYDVQSDKANASMVCLTATMDLWMKLNPPKMCYYRCQLRISNITVDPKTLSSTTSPACPFGFYSNLQSNICYIFNSSRQTFHDASRSCASLGATLPYFNNVWEYDVDYLNVKTGKIHAGCFPNMTHHWLAIKSVLNLGNIGFCNFTDINNMSLSFTRWVAYPNCSANLCVVGDYDTINSWKPIDCSERKPFYCQYRLDSSSTNAPQSSPTTPYQTSNAVSNCQSSSLITSLISSTRSSQSSITSNATTIREIATISHEEKTSPSISLNASITVQTTFVKTQKMISSTVQPPTSSANQTPLVTSNAPSAFISSTRIISTTGIQNCIYNEWSSFSDCSSSCGKMATKFRTRASNVSYGLGKCAPQNESLSCGNLLECNPMSDLEDLIAKILSATGCSYIIGASAISFGASVAMRSYSFERMILMCEELTLCFAHVLVSTMSMRINLNIACRWAALGMQFFFTSLFIFILLESLQSYAIYTNVISSGQIIPTKFALLCGFGLPLLITGLTGTIGYSNLTSQFSCFINWGHDISLASLIPVLVTLIAAFVSLEAAGMGHFPRLPLTCEFQMHAAIINRHALVFKLPLITLSWFLMSMGIYFKIFLWFPNIFIINVSLGCTMVAFHLLGNEKVVHLVRHVKEKIGKNEVTE